MVVAVVVGVAGGGGGGVLGPLTLKFDRATLSFLKFDRRHWTPLKSTGKVIK